MSSLTYRINFVILMLLSVWLVVPLLSLAQEATSTNEVSSVDSIATTTSTSAAESAIPENAFPASFKAEQLPDGAVIGDFVVGPGKVELQIAPGQSKTVNISVSNRTGSAKVFNLEMEDAAGSKDPNTPIVLLGEQVGPYSMKDFIRVDDDSFIIEHNQRIQIPVTVTIPSNAEPGGLYGSLLVTTTSVDPVNETGAPRSAIVSRIGTLFFITVPGAIERSGQVIDFATVPKQTFFSAGPINLGVVYENTGSMYLNPYGSITVTNLFGEEVGFVEIQPWFVLPQSLRLREITWDRELLLGRYTFTAEINRGYDNVIDTKTIHIWVLPWQFLLGVFAGLFFIIIIFRFILSRFEFKRKPAR
jgi:hypothetical protein